MQTTPGQAAPALPDLLADGSLAGDWVLDPVKSSIRLTSGVLGRIVRVTGTFRQVSGTGTISPDGQVSGTLTVATASIDTRQPKRDTHLRSADFFDSDNNPDITFSTEGIRPSGQGVAVTGVLTVRDRSRPLDFAATAAVDGDDEVRLDAEVHIDRAEFGLTWNLLGMVSMHNILTIHAVFTRQ